MEKTRKTEGSDSMNLKSSTKAFAKSSILRTKFHPPRLIAGTISRPRLIDKLKNDVVRPFTLISAPAGFGKSILAAQWLEASSLPGVWFSLNKDDNDMRTFLSYLVEAIRLQFPLACPNVFSILSSVEIPGAETLAKMLASDLEGVGTPFILVLDDYHLINQARVHELLGNLLDHPFSMMHLVIVTRRDPPFRFAAMQRTGPPVEVRESDLRFREDETLALVEEIIGVNLKPTTLALVMSRFEGWIVGLRLAFMGMNNTENQNDYIEALEGHSIDIQHYVLQQVLSVYPPGIRNCLMASSILDRFCGPLIEALGAADICGHGLCNAGKEGGGEAFLHTLEEGRLFAVPLNADGSWVRYHHFFQRILQDMLHRRCDAKEISALHLCASEWFESEGLIDEALEHALEAGEMDCAADIIKRNQFTELESERWYVVEGWHGRISADHIHNCPELLIARAWIEFEYYNVEKILHILDRIKELVGASDGDRSWFAHYQFFMGVTQYCLGQSENSLKFLNRAKSLLPAIETMLHGNVDLYLSLAQSMNGEAGLAIAELNEKLASVQFPSEYRRIRLTGGLCFSYYFSGNYLQAQNAATVMRAIARGGGFVYAEYWGDYLEACANLTTYHLDEAEKLFGIASSHQHVLTMRPAYDATAALALVRQLMGDEKGATEAVNRLHKFALDKADPKGVGIADACRARVALLRGDLDWAIHWASGYSEEPLGIELAMWVEIPVLTQARVLIAAGSADKIDRALDLLRQIRELTESCHYVSQVIEVMVLQSLALEKQGQAETALAVLAEAIVLAKPGGCIRPFIEAGPAMTGMLERLLAVQAEDSFILRLRSQFTLAENKSAPAGDNAADVSPLIESLTNRELDVLENLNGRLSDKEIAKHLHISVTTVRTHLKHLYEKLQVNSRREAVLKAVELGIIL